MVLNQIPSALKEATVTTIEIKCEESWLPPSHGILTGRASTAWSMAEWAVEATPHIINDVDRRSVDDAISSESVWADFHGMHRPINAAEVLIIVRPPQVDGTFVDREMRRLELAKEFRKVLSAEFLTNNDHLIVPKWEIEVIPEETSGFGITPKLEVAYEW